MNTVKKREVDMLHGSMFKKILMFALPLAAGSVLQQLFNAVDLAVVGLAGSQAQAAVGSNSSVVSLLVNLFVGVSAGSNVVIANLIGKGERDKVKSVVHTSILLSLISGVLLMIIGLAVAKPLLTMMSTPDDVIDMAVLYLRIYCIGMPFIMVYNFGAAILRSIGDTKRPLICLLIPGILNAGLNLFFVLACNMAADGVAIATVISNGIGAVMMFYFLMHTDEVVRVSPRLLKVNFKDLSGILRIGVPAGIQGVVFSISNVVIQTSINSFLSAAVAGSAAAANFEYISYFAVSGYNMAVMTFVSQNLGAGNMKRCLRAYGIGMGCALGTVLILNIGVYLLRYRILGIFTSDPEVVSYAVQRLTIVLLTHFMICSYEITGAALRGLGKSLLPALLTVFGTCVLRIVYVNTVVAAHHTFPVLMAVYPVSWLVTGSAVIIAFVIVWKKMGKEQAVKC